LVKHVELQASRLAAWFRRHPAWARVALRCIPDAHWHICIPEIGRLRIRLRRNRSLWLRPPLTHEWYPMAALRTFVRPTDIVWDIGGNIGLYARWLATHLGARHVYTFEPMSENLGELGYNIRSGGVADRVTIVPWALSDVDGEVEFQIDDMQSASGTISTVSRGCASAGRLALALPPKTETVQSRTIDSIIDSRALPAPDVLKVDVEGAERMVLEGGRSFFSSEMPRLVIETHGLDLSRRCLEFLLDLGYTTAACVPEEADRSRHMIVERSYLSRMADRYDAHFVMAAKDAGIIPAKLDYAHH
jgi:FkbM family methyltransferase